MGKNNNNNKKNNPNGGIKGSAKSGNKNNPNGGIKGSAKSANNNENKKNNPNGGVKGSAKAAAASVNAPQASQPAAAASTPAPGSASLAVAQALSKNKKTNKNKQNNPNGGVKGSASSQIANAINGDGSGQPWQSAANRWNPSMAATDLEGGYKPSKGTNAGNRLDMNAYNNNSAYVGQAAIDRAMADGWTTDEIVYAMDADNLKRGANAKLTSSNLRDMDSGEYGTWSQLFDNNKNQMQSIASVDDPIYSKWKDQGIDTIDEWWAYRKVADAEYRAKYPNGAPGDNRYAHFGDQTRAMIAKKQKEAAFKRVAAYGENDSWAKFLTPEEIKRTVADSWKASNPSPASSSTSSSSSSSSSTDSQSSTSSSSSPSSTTPTSSTPTQSTTPYTPWDFDFGKQITSNAFEDTFLTSSSDDSDKKKEDPTGTSIYNSIISSTLGNSVVNPIANPSTFQSIISNT